MPKPARTPLLTNGIITVGLIGLVAWLDFVTGYEHALFLFYLVPVLFVRRWAGQGAAFGMAIACAMLWLAVNLAEGQPYEDWLTITWETTARLGVFLMIIVLLSKRQELQLLVRQRTEKLHREMRERVLLEKELLGIAEAEQRRIGQDLHDSLGQHLTGVALAGKVLVKKLEGRSAEESLAASQLVCMVEDAIDITRKLARSLHPIEMRSDGLADALQNLSSNITKTFGIDCHFLRSGGGFTAGAETASQFFRIAQEAVNNAIRHGRANQIIIRLDAAGDKMLLSVTDNGVGLAADARSGNGLGLRIMAYRARMVGASFDIQNLSAGGARAVCILNPGHSDTELYGNETEN